jgi:hypothetical protein
MTDKTYTTKSGKTLTDADIGSPPCDAEGSTPVGHVARQCTGR